MQVTTGSFWTSPSGIGYDKPASDHPKSSIHKLQSDSVYRASAIDDGHLASVNPFIRDPAAIADVKTSSLKDQWRVVEVRGDDRVVIDSAGTSQSDMWGFTYMVGPIRLRWSTNFTINQGVFEGAVCAVKNSDNWKVKWTGQPLVDSYVTQAGKIFYNFIVDMVLDCTSYDPKSLDFVYEYELKWLTPFRDVWNWVMTSTVNIMPTTPFYLSLKPLLYSSYPSARPAALHEAEHDDVEYRRMYPELFSPSAPEDIPTRDESPPKRRFARALTKLFSFKPRKNSSD